MSGRSADVRLIVGSPCTRMEIWVREGEKEMAFTVHCLSCGAIGSDHPAFKVLWDQPKATHEIFEDHLRALREAVLDFLDHVEGRIASQRNYRQELNPEGVPWSERDPWRSRMAPPTKEAPPPE